MYGGGKGNNHVGKVICPRSFDASTEYKPDFLSASPVPYPWNYTTSQWDMALSGLFIYSERLGLQISLVRKKVTLLRFTFNFSSSGFFIKSFDIPLFTYMQWSIHEYFKKWQTCTFMNLSSFITILKEEMGKIIWTYCKNRIKKKRKINFRRKQLAF